MEAAGRIKYHLQPFPIHSLSLSLGPFISPACLSLQSQLLPFPLSCHRRPRGCSPLPPPPPPPPSASPTDRPTDRPRQCLTPLSRLAAFLSPPPASRQSANHPGAMRSCRPPARLAVPSCVLHRATRRSTHSTRREFGGRGRERAIAARAKSLSSSSAPLPSPTDGRTREKERAREGHVLLSVVVGWGSEWRERSIRKEKVHGREVVRSIVAALPGATTTTAATLRPQLRGT